MVRVFIDHGDRTDRTKARLKYVLDKMGVEKFLGLMEEKLGRKLDRAVPGALAPRPPFSAAPRISAFMRRSRTGCNWIGVVVPVGRLTVAQMRGLADIARELGDGDIRLTVWQNLLISGVPTEKLKAAQEKIEALGLAIEANAIRAGLIACTGNTGCKFAASDTKRHAEEIARWCETRVCARHAGQHPSHRLPSFLRAAFRVRDRAARLQGAGDRGGRSGRGLSRADRRRLRALRRARPRALSRRQGGGRAADRSSASSRPIWRTALPSDESFIDFARRHEIDALKAMTRAEAAA